MLKQARFNKTFEDGLYDARRNAVEPLAYQVSRDYRQGVDIARQLTTTLGAALSDALNRTMEPTHPPSSIEKTDRTTSTGTHGRSPISTMD